MYTCISYACRILWSMLSCPGVCFCTLYAVTMGFLPESLGIYKMLQELCLCQETSLEDASQGTA